MMKQKKIGWETWLKQGDQYNHAAKPRDKPSKFGGSIRYNLLSMSLEAYIMAILDYNKRMPDNHTYTELLDALDEVVPLDDKLKQRILKYENIQSICSLEQFHISTPTENDLTDLHGAIGEIQSLAHTTCLL